MGSFVVTLRLSRVIVRLLQPAPLPFRRRQWDHRRPPKGGEAKCPWHVISPPEQKSVVGWALARPLRRLDRSKEARLSGPLIRRMPKVARPVDRMRLDAGCLTVSKVVMFGPNATDSPRQACPANCGAFFCLRCVHFESVGKKKTDIQGMSVCAAYCLMRLARSS